MSPAWSMALKRWPRQMFRDVLLGLQLKTGSRVVLGGGRDADLEQCLIELGLDVLAARRLESAAAASRNAELVLLVDDPQVVSDDRLQIQNRVLLAEYLSQLAPQGTLAVVARWDQSAGETLISVVERISQMLAIFPGQLTLKEYRHPPTNGDWRAYWGFSSDRGVAAISLTIPSRPIAAVEWRQFAISGPRVPLRAPAA